MDAGPRSPSSSTASTRCPRASTTRGYVGPLGAAHVRDGRARLRAERRARTICRAMERELRDAMRAGAIGFTTSRSPSHETPDGGRSRAAWRRWDEVRRLVGVMGEMNAGHVRDRRRRRGPRGRRPGAARLPRAAARSRRRDGPARSPSACSAAARSPTSGATTSLCSRRRPRAAGACSRRCTAARSTRVLSFKTQMPFDRLPRVEGAARAAARRAADAAAARSRAASPSGGGRAGARRAPSLGTEARLAVYDWLFVLDTVKGRTARWPRSRASAACDPGRGDDRSRAREGPRSRSSCSPIANEDQDSRPRADASIRGRSSRSRTPARTSRSSWTPRSRRTC